MEGLSKQPEEVLVDVHRMKKHVAQLYEAD